MKIKDIWIGRVSVPFKKPITWGSGIRDGVNRLIVEITTDSGIKGLGETFHMSFTEAVLKQNIKPLIIGEDPHDIEKINRKIEGMGFYHHQRAMTAALAAVNIALMDIIAKAAGQPLYKILGGKYRDPIAMIGYMFIDQPEVMAQTAKGLIGEGFTTIKVKVGVDEQHDIESIAAVREAIGPAVQLRVDANQAWAIGTAKRQIQKLQKYDPQYVEQPTRLDDLIGMAELRRSVSVPIAACEAAYTTYDVMNIIRHGAADVINVDPHRAGGIWQAKKICAIAESACLPVNVHSGVELGISTAALLHIACSTPNILYAIDSHYHHQADDIITEPFRYEKGTIKVPEGPGLGVELDPAKVEKYASAPPIDLYVPLHDSWIPDKPKY
jgi:L-rhamnonate dehydratase